MMMKSRELFIKNVNNNPQGAAALSLRLFCYARFMAVKNIYAETHDWVYENELTNENACSYVFRTLDEDVQRPSMDMLIKKLKSLRLVRDSLYNGRNIYIIKFSDVEMEELMNKSVIDKPNTKLTAQKTKKSVVKKDVIVSKTWKESFLDNPKGRNMQMLRYWYFMEYYAQKNGKKYISKNQALSSSAIEYVFKGLPKKVDELLALILQMKQSKLIVEDVRKNERVFIPANLEGIDIKSYIKDKPVDLNSFNYTNVY